MRVMATTGTNCFSREAILPANQKFAYRATITAIHPTKTPFAIFFDMSSFYSLIIPPIIFNQYHTTIDYEKPDYNHHSIHLLPTFICTPIRHHTTTKPSSAITTITAKPRGNMKKGFVCSGWNTCSISFMGARLCSVAYIRGLE